MIRQSHAIQFSRRLLILALVMIASAARTSIAQDEAPALQQQARQAMAAGDWEGAREALESYLNDSPNDRDALYDLAVACAQLKDLDAATQALVKSIEHGFIDFRRLERDGRLAPIRGTSEWNAIMAGWRRLLDARADANEQSVRALFGAAYHYERDANLRLIYASAFPELSFEVAQREIEHVAAWAFGNVFKAPVADDPKPDPWVTVLLPTPEHFLGFMLQLGAGPNVGGLYDHDRSQLICQDIGPSLRHEFLHVLHWRLMTRLGQAHPDWIMEGLGAMVEEMDPDPESPGRFRPAPSWRTNIAKRLLDLGRLMTLDELMSMDRSVFRSRRPNANYAQARAFMMFLEDCGALPSFFLTYQETYPQDQSGRLAVERVMEAPLANVEADYRAWLAELPEAAEEIVPGMASLGVVVAAGRGDGPVIDEIVAGTPARRSGLRMRDVILSVDGRSTRSLPDLVRVLSGYDVGELVTVEVRRGARRLSLEVELIAR